MKFSHMFGIMASDEYSRVSMEKSTDGDHSDDESFHGQKAGLISGFSKPEPKFWKRRFLKKGLWITAAAVLVGSYVGVYFVGRHSFTEKELDETCLWRTSPYSPVLKHLDPTPKLTQFNGTLGYPSEFTGKPSPELDAVWDKWAYVKYASIPEDEFMKLPGAKDHFQDAAKLTPEYGGGYVGFVEFSHHMHASEIQN